MSHGNLLPHNAIQHTDALGLATVLGTGLQVFACELAYRDTGLMVNDAVSDADRAAVAWQLGRVPRAMVAVAHRCECGLPDVVTTKPVLDDGKPFPTVFYLTCPRLAGAIGTLESQGVMKQLQQHLADDPQLREGYRRAHQDYLVRRNELGEAPQIADVSAGGMPQRVKCLHALVAHSLAAGPGVNPIGDAALQLLAAEQLPDRTSATCQQLFQDAR